MKLEAELGACITPGVESPEFKLQYQQKKKLEADAFSR
jgi:hypothetical protein